MAKEKINACPCSSGRTYADCCGRFLDAGEFPATAEALMRSRYTAYTLANETYLLDTWQVATRPNSLDLQAPPAPKWIGLKVLRHEQLDPDHAVVEFVARYKLGGRAFKLHETSRFVNQGGRWFYVDGETS